MTERILIIEDEADIAEPMRLGLVEEGFIVQIARTGEQALRALANPWDLIVLDLMLPDISGEAILSNLKQRPDYPSVLILTARGSLQDKLSLFRQGCDDYLVKPFIFEELVERVRALLRRSQRVTPSQLRYEDLSLNANTFRLASAKGEVLLTPKETAILRLFIGSPGKVISRKEILHHVWGMKEEPETNFIGVHLFNLRKKLAEVHRDSWLQTVRNSGFLFLRGDSNAP